MSERSRYKFDSRVREAFGFVSDLGFVEVDATPTLVRYRKSDLEIEIYHGRNSYEISASFTAQGIRYSMSELIRLTDSETGNAYRAPTVTTPDEVASALEQLRSLIKRYAKPVLEQDEKFFWLLRKQRKNWSQEYSLDVLAEQLRPQAQQAFQRGDYAKAAELYGQIRARLTPAECKKLTLAEKRCKK